MLCTNQLVINTELNGRNIELRDFVHYPAYYFVKHQINNKDINY